MYRILCNKSKKTLVNIPGSVESGSVIFVGVWTVWTPLGITENKNIHIKFKKKYDELIKLSY